jgi:hypothetical protein
LKSSVIVVCAKHREPENVSKSTKPKIKFFIGINFYKYLNIR